MSSVVFYGCETWTAGKRQNDRIKSFEMWIWTTMERIKCLGRVSNLEVQALSRLNDTKRIPLTIPGVVFSILLALNTTLVTQNNPLERAVFLLKLNVNFCSTKRYK